MHDVTALITPGDHTRPTSTAARTLHSRRDGDGLRMLLLGGYVFLLPVQVAVTDDLRLAPSDLFVVAYLVLLGPRLRHAPGAWTVWPAALLGVLGLGVVVSLATTGSVTTYALLQKCGGLVVLLLTALCLVDAMRTVRDVVLLLRVLVAGVVLNLVVALLALTVQLADPAALPRVNYLGTRLSGLLVDPNAFGGLLALTLVLHVLTTGTAVALVPRRAELLVTGLLTVGLVLTFSRSAWIAAAAGLMTAAIVAGRSALRAVAPVALAGLVAVPVLAALYVPDLARLASRPSQVDDRLSLADGALESFGQSPLWGIGLGVFPTRYDQIVHTTALWFLAETGLVGLLVFAGFALSFAGRMHVLHRVASPSVARLALALLCAHVAMLGLSLGIEALYQRHWWLVLAAGGALVSMHVLAREDAAA